MDFGGGLSVTVQQETYCPSSGRVLLKVDPSGEFACFHVPNPNAKEFVDDELAERAL
jgi:hypothetical protein